MCPTAYSWPDVVAIIKSIMILFLNAPDGSRLFVEESCACTLHLGGCGGGFTSLWLQRRALYKAPAKQQFEACNVVEVLMTSSSEEK
jgi:hypothetical protein